MNLAYKFPIIFWDCACLITDSGGSEEQEEEVVDIYEEEDQEEFEYVDSPDRKTKIKKRRANNYGKIATAIGKMPIKVVPPDINESLYTFYPNVKENKILYGLRGLVNVGDDIIQDIIKNRPYSSPEDFVNKINPKKLSMISLIKAGAFDNLMERKKCLSWYILETCDIKNKLTLQNMPMLIAHNLIPESLNEQLKIYEFNRYLKTLGKVKIELDTRSLEFLTKINYDYLTFSEGGSNLYIMQKDWEKVYKKEMEKIKAWMTQSQEEILKQLNEKIFSEEWDKYVKKDNISSWEMESMSFYYHEHELAHINGEKYGISNFFHLPERPEVERTFKKGNKVINLFKLTKICGTCIDKDKMKGLITLLTPQGVVTVKLNKELFAIFDKQISEKGFDGKKHVLEKSWFNKGSMVVFQGIRMDDMFIAKKYNSTGGHHVYRIETVAENGDLMLRSERYQGDEN